MSNAAIPFQKIKWDEIPKVEHKGESGSAWWRTAEFAGLRVRIVEYSPGYLADHWCQKGHIVHCLSGECVTEQADGEKLMLTVGQSYIVSDDLSSHRSFTENGVKLLIIDGDFFEA
jgi:hypothetical protein